MAVRKSFSPAPINSSSTARAAHGLGNFILIWRNTWTTFASFTQSRLIAIITRPPVTRCIQVIFAPEKRASVPGSPMVLALKTRICQGMSCSSMPVHSAEQPIIQMDFCQPLFNPLACATKARQSSTCFPRKNSPAASAQPSISFTN